jgi:hypothetical protein
LCDGEAGEGSRGLGVVLGEGDASFL